METIYKRITVLPALLIMLAVSVGLYFLLTYLDGISQDHNYIYDFGALMGDAATLSPIWKIIWVLTDITECTFIASLPATILLLIGAFIGAHLERKGSRFMGTGVDGNGKIFNWIVGTGFCGVLFASYVYHPWFSVGYVPTFCSFLSIAAMVITFKANSLPKAATIAILSGLVNTPVCYFFVNHYTAPQGIPLFIAVDISIVIIVPICSEILYRLPWMKDKEASSSEQEEVAEDAPSETEIPETSLAKENIFLINRALGDVTEMCFMGTSIGTIGMYIGCIISVVLSPLHDAFNIPVTVPAQIATAALCVFIWYTKWKKEGWVFTFPALLFVSAVSITYPLKASIMIPSILIAVFCIQPFMSWIMKITKYEGRWPAVAYVLFSVCTFCIPWCLFVTNFLI